MCSAAMLLSSTEAPLRSQGSFDALLSHHTCPGGGAVPRRCSAVGASQGLAVAAAADILHAPGCQALPSEQSPQWNQREELQDMFSIYISHVIDEAKQADMQSLLGLSDKEADSLRDTVSSGSFKLDEEKDDDSFF